MTDYKYLIVGGGMTADAAVKGIRSVDVKGSIGIIGNEENPPYNRPPLSKGLWKGDKLETIWRDMPKDDVEIHLSRTVKSIDVKKKTVTDEEGTTYSFNKLLLATGGAVRKLSYPLDGIIYYRTLNDYKKLKELTEKKNSFAVIGGGFIGSEIAAALTMNKKQVTMIFPEDSIGARIYPKMLSNFLNEYYKSKGVEVLAKHNINNIEEKDSTFVIKTNDGKELKFDVVIAGIGIQPNVELAQSAGLKTDNGIIVNEFLQTSNADIYAAGDAANFYNPALNKRMRVEHEDNANMMGEVAGKNMAGSNQVYHHLPFFYSDLFDLGYEAVGELDTQLEIVEDWKDEFHEGVVYYLRDSKICGVLLWNTWEQVDAARKLIAEKKQWNKKNLKGRLPE